MREMTKMTPWDVEQKHMEDLSLLTDPGSQCEYLIMLGISGKACEEVRKDDYRISGCKTAIWLKSWMEEGKLHFIYDSDSLLVKGVLAVFQEMYEERTPQEAAVYPPRFIDTISDEVLYPEVRNNGILSCFQRLATLNQK